MEGIFGIAGIVKSIQKVKEFHHSLKERDQKDVQINGIFCGGIITDMFVKNGQLIGPGKIQGRCGYKKDHSRTFCCKDCYNRIF